MKKYLNLSALATIAVMLFLTACSADDQENGTSFVPTPVKFSAGLNDATIAVTRAYSWNGTEDAFANYSIGGAWVYNATAANADKVMLFSVNDKNGSAATDIEGYEYYVSATGNVLSATNAATNGQFYWMTSGESKKVIAWSKGKTATLSKSDFDLDATNHYMSYTVSSDQSGATWNEELLWGYGVLTAAGTTNIDMYHQLARVDIQITAKGASNKASDIYIGRNAATTAIAGGSEEFLALQGNFTPLLDHKNNLYNVTTDYNSTGPVIGAWPTTVTAVAAAKYGAWTPEVPASKQYIVPHTTATYSDPVAVSTKGDHVSQYSAVVIPQTHTASKFVLFELVVDGIRYVYIPTTAVTWDAGKQYKYDITVTSTGLSVTATIQNWAHTASEEFDGNANLD